LVSSGSEAALLDRPGGIFVRPAQLLSGEDRLVMLAAARIVLADHRGSRAEPAVPPANDALPQLPPGHFAADGREYVIVLDPGRPTPAPWANVLANPQFGTVLSESGGAYTWSETAHEFRLTPWSNDPVGDGAGEALYLRDEDDGRCWSPSPLPC